MRRSSYSTHEGFGVEIEVWGHARCLDGLDTLHGEPVHLKLNQLLRLEPEGERGGGVKPELNQCHVTWFKAANSMLPGGWEMQGDSSFYQWQCVGLACWFHSQFPASSEGCWRQTAATPPLLCLLTSTTTALSSTPLCFVFQLTGQRERRQCAGSQAKADTFFWRPSSLSIPVLSIVLCFLFPFPFLSSQLMTRASCSRRIIHRFFFNNCL